MSPMRRVLLCGLILTCGLAAQASLETYTKIERPPLRRSLATLPRELGTGSDAIRSSIPRS